MSNQALRRRGGGRLALISEKKTKNVEKWTTIEAFLIRFLLPYNCFGPSTFHNVLRCLQTDLALFEVFQAGLLTYGTKVKHSKNKFHGVTLKCCFIKSMIIDKYVIDTMIKRLF